MLGALKNVRAELPDVIEQSIMENEGEIILRNQEQLLEGKNDKGNDLRPYYTEDPYFKSTKTAMAYARFKQKITPNPNRNPNAPNLFVTGRRVHDKMKLVKNSGAISVDILDTIRNVGAEIKRRYKGALGLDEKNMEWLYMDKVLPKIERTCQNNGLKK